jgi:hypothetical protein
MKEMKVRNNYKIKNHKAQKMSLALCGLLESANAKFQ